MLYQLTDSTIRKACDFSSVLHVQSSAYMCMQCILKCRIRLKVNSRKTSPEDLASGSCLFIVAVVWLLQKRLIFYSPRPYVRAEKQSFSTDGKLKLKDYDFTLCWQARKWGGADLPASFCDLSWEAAAISSLLVHFHHTGFDGFCIQNSKWGQGLDSIHQESDVKSKQSLIVSNCLS